MIVPNSSVSPVDIRVRWYYLFFLTLKNWCIISQESIHGPRPANLHTQLKLLLCLRKVLHAFSNRKLHCLLRTITDCSVAPVKAEYKSRSEGTLPLFPGGKQFPCDGQNHEADYKDLLMRAIEKGRIKNGGQRDCIELMPLKGSSILLESYQPSGQGLKGWHWLSWDYF